MMASCETIPVYVTVATNREAYAKRTTMLAVPVEGQIIRFAVGYWAIINGVSFIFEGALCVDCEPDEHNDPGFEVVLLDYGFRPFREVPEFDRQAKK